MTPTLDPLNIATGLVNRREQNDGCRAGTEHNGVNKHIERLHNPLIDRMFYIGHSGCVGGTAQLFAQMMFTLKRHFLTRFLLLARSF
jgi:hypothetical protein